MCIAFFEITRPETGGWCNTGTPGAQPKHSWRTRPRPFWSRRPTCASSSRTSFLQLVSCLQAGDRRRRLYDLGSRQWDIPRLRVLLEKSSRNRKRSGTTKSTTIPAARSAPMRLHGRRLSRGDLPLYVLLNFEDLTERFTVDAFKARAESSPGASAKQRVSRHARSRASKPAGGPHPRSRSPGGRFDEDKTLEEAGE